jgi:cell division septation protein DedD
VSRPEWIRNAGRVFLLLPALAALVARAGLGQTDPRLVEVIRDAQEGDSDSARIKVQRLLTATPPTDTLYPQIVYTQAMVASDASDMRRQLQRVAVEYSASSWADDALLRLVQLDYASGNLDGAARNLERIRLDYPGSPLTAQAAYWAARTFFDQKKPEVACRWIGEGLSGSPANIELQNQLRYLNQRCSQYAASPAPQPSRVDTQAAVSPRPDSQQVIASGPIDTARSGAGLRDTAPAPATTSVPTPRPSPPAPRADSAVVPTPTTTGTTHYRIQLTAVRSQATAQSLANKLKAKGFHPITVEEGGLFKVRIGDYASKAEAAAAVPQIKAKLGGSPFVVAGS